MRHNFVLENDFFTLLGPIVTIQHIRNERQNNSAVFHNRQLTGCWKMKVCEYGSLRECKRSRTRTCSRLQFCNLILHHQKRVCYFGGMILFSDEATFHLDGYVNFHNAFIYAFIPCSYCQITKVGVDHMLGNDLARSRDNLPCPKWNNGWTALPNIL